jgi:NAD(P)-dependent dehydrogenase (short-subunit alcohol dehydrogenase family)
MVTSSEFGESCMAEQTTTLTELFSLEGQVAVVTGGTGVLGGAMARGLARAGAKVGVLGRRKEKAEAAVQAIEAERGTALALPADVLDRGELEAAREAVLERWGRLDVLVNAAGGNMPSATLEPGQSFFDLPVEGMEPVIALNLKGTLLPSQVFGEAMARAGRGCIVNISSMAAQRAMTRVVGYGAAKAAVENVTRWLAVELARSFGAGLRVNAIAPGFFIGEQNRALLLNEDGSLTARGQMIIDHTPAGRFGEPDELIGALIWLCSPGAGFVNGSVVAVDGGFGAFSGV